MDDSQDRVRKFLAARGADQVPHSGRTLLEHLVGTSELLRSWGCSEQVCAAGLLHSVYGTNAFRAVTVDPSERRAVAAVAGTEAESLAYLFATSDRPGAFLAAVRGRELRNRLTGEPARASLEALTNLVQIECANLIEQGTGAEFLREVVGLTDGGGLVLREELVRHVQEFLANREPPLPAVVDLSQLDPATLLSASGQFAVNDYVRLPNAIPATILALYYRYAKSYAPSRRYFEFEPRTSSLGRYADAIGEILLEDLRPGVERITGRRLLPTYSFLRFYTPESVLKKHLDRGSCEYGLTISIGKESSQHAWPIQLERNGETRSVDLAVGDVLLYRGTKLPHWRNPLPDGNWLQLFLHYVDADGAYAAERFDRRQSLGPVVKERL
ncbi:DUF6817 domain-containing protein [Luteimonas sp. SDU101]|uniref:DUF6817 domain-containing protein n=1 Tax=unclassified Luteimonas TaxID=2629088 RepID=UPI003EBE79FE